MGRPIQKKWFGPATTAGSQIVVNGVRWADNTTATSAYIVKQTGSAAYIVSNGSKSEIVFMVNANSVSALLPGQCFILAKPFGGSPLPCSKIAQFRVDIFDVANTVARETGDPAVEAISSYTWSTIPATARGQADLITGAGAVGAILSVAVNIAGFGYSTAPSVSFTGGGVGATATASVANGVVTGVAVNTAGYNYANGGVTLGAPPAAVRATATGVQAGGVVQNTIVITNGGRYYATPPAVTITGGPGINAAATAVVSNGVVTGITVTNGGSGYTTPLTVTVALAPASVQATATATISS